MSKTTTLFLFLGVIAVAVVAAAFIGPDDILYAVFPELETVAAEESTLEPDAGATEAVDTNTATLTETLTPIPPTETFTPIPPTATEVPREIGCGPACEKIRIVLSAASQVKGYVEGDILAIPFDEFTGSHCIPYEEYFVGGVPTNEIASCLDLGPSGMQLCNPSATAWHEDQCLGDYTLAIFSLDGLTNADLPLFDEDHFGGWFYPTDLLSNTLYHLYGVDYGYLPIMITGDFSGPLTIEALREKFLCVYEPQMLVSPELSLGGSIPNMSEHLVAAYPMGSGSGDVIRNFSNQFDADSGTVDNHVVIEGLPVYWLDLRYQTCP